LTLYARNGSAGLELYLGDAGMPTQFLTTRRRNGLLYLLLRDGIHVDDLRRLKPSRNPSRQKIYHYAQNLLKLIDTYLKYEAAEAKNIAFAAKTCYNYPAESARKSFDWGKSSCIIFEARGQTGK